MIGLCGVFVLDVLEDIIKIRVIVSSGIWRTLYGWEDEFQHEKTDST